MLAAGVLAWAACAIGAAGLFYAYNQGEFALIAKGHERDDLGMSLLMGIAFGPVGLLVAFLGTGFGKYGWRLR